MRASFESTTHCAVCGSELAGQYGWCGGCAVALCLACGREHYCRPSCPANGCMKGLCVRLVSAGKLSDEWGLPAD